MPMNEDDLQEFRRQRLTAWITDHGGLAAVVAARRLKLSYQSYLSQVVHGLAFGSRAARTCESRLGMPALWLDAGALDQRTGANATLLFTSEPGQDRSNKSSPALLIPWPHSGVTLYQWQALTDDERLQLDGALLTAYAQILRQRREQAEANAATPQRPQGKTQGYR